VSNEHEDELIDRWRRGDARAFEALIERWQAGVARFLAYYASETGAVEDLCQEVFLRVHLGRGRYRPEGAFSTWLYRIALNVARDAVRRRERRQRMEARQTSGSNGEAADVGCERREARELVSAALGMLPEKLRVVVLLRHYEKMSFAEMSRVLHIPANTLKSRFAAALNQLRINLQQLGWTAEDDV
jgi:RNA polymerase sigma-70 factor (ECF subfamily)